MRITFLTPHIGISGGVQIILKYASKLTEREHEVTVICPQPTLAMKHFVPYPKRAMMNLLRHKPDWTDVAANIRYVPSYEERYIPDGDIVVATAWQTASYVKDYSSRKGKKFYLIMHYESLFHGNKDEVDRTYAYPLRKIVISNWLREIMKVKFCSKSELIEYPVDPEMFYPTKTKCGENRRICMLHHTYPWKGITESIRAFEMAKQAYPDIRLVMFGAHKKEIGADCEYYYRPYGKQLREIYDSSDIFLCASWKEGLGMPPMQAMACKCALVTTDNGGSRDFAIHEKTALVSPPKNPEALAENLKKLLNSQELLERIARNGYEFIRAYSSWDTAISKLEKAFLEN